jgi:septum formation inhibitor-activating ATPase MinD
LKRNNLSLDHLDVVAMSTGYTGELPVKAVIKVLEIAHLHCVPDDPVATTMSTNVGSPLVLEFPQSKASEAIRRIAGSLTGIPEMADQHTKRKGFLGAKAATILALNALSSYR